MKTYVLDTHPLIYSLFKPTTLPEKVANILSNEDIKFSIPLITILEIKYLIEIGRVSANISDIVSHFHSLPNFYFQEFDEHIMLISLDIKDQRDPFDRIILSTAMAYKLPIITKDRWMTSYYKNCIWK